MFLLGEAWLVHTVVLNIPIQTLASVAKAWKFTDILFGWGMESRVGVIFVHVLPLNGSWD